MANFRVSIMMRQDRAGWSESFYTDTSDQAAALTRIQAAGIFRRALLSTDAAIIGYRSQAVTGLGASLLAFVDEPATLTYAEDTPYQSLLAKLRTTDGLERTYLMRGLPDLQAKVGLFAPEPAYATALANWATHLSNGTWQVRRVDRTQPKIRVASIDGTGLVSTIGAHGLNVGHRLTFLRTRDSLGNAVTGNFSVVSTPTTQSLVVNPWTSGRLVTTGTLRRTEYLYPIINQMRTDNRVVSRRVGRPFGSPVGRR
jgi:hypothetical protein